MKHSDKHGRTLRILTYNVHRWLGTDRQISPHRIAEVIASCNPDIVALQEVRVGRVRSGEVDQAAAVAARLGMDLHFQPTIRILGEVRLDHLQGYVAGVGADRPTMVARAFREAFGAVLGEGLSETA